MTSEREAYVYIQLPGTLETVPAALLRVQTLPDGTQIELFSFPDPPRRPSYPEACGLRHLAFEVAGLDEAVRELEGKGVVVEPVRIDEHTGRRFTFFADPDGLPLELYER